jgi:hypothetical protein
VIKLVSRKSFGNLKSKYSKYRESNIKRQQEEIKRLRQLKIDQDEAERRAAEDKAEEKRIQEEYRQLRKQTSRKKRSIRIGNKSISY